MTYNGEAYRIMAFGSDVCHVHHPNRPVLVDQSTVSFFENKPPTTEVILQRPLKGIALPEGLWRPHDLHPDTIGEWAHGCAVQMLYRSVNRSSQHGRGDTQGANRENERLPMLSIGSIQEELDICFTELNYVEGQFLFEAHGWREEGIPSAMVVRFCEKPDTMLHIPQCAEDLSV